MPQNLDYKLILAIFTTCLSLWGFYSYFKDIFQKRTKPHLYTWLVWAITQGTATVALIYGGGRFGAISLAVGTILVITIFFLSFKYGTKNITVSDKITLAVALLAVIVWWQLKSPLLAVIMVSAIDGIGYIPTYRKTFQEPWTELPMYWVIMSTVSILGMIANAEYNFLTMAYLIVLAVSNATVFTICAIRRKTVPNPNINK